MGDKASAPGKYAYFVANAYKSCLHPTSCVFDAYLGTWMYRGWSTKPNTYLSRVLNHCMVYYFRVPIRPLDLRYNSKTSFKCAVCVHNIYTGKLSDQHRIWGEKYTWKFLDKNVRFGIHTYTNRNAWFQTRWMRDALFWVITQRVLVIPCRRFGTTYRSHLQGWRIQKETLKMGPTRYSETSVRNYH